MVANLDLRLAVALGGQTLLCFLLHLQSDDVGSLRAPRQTTEVALGELLHLVNLEVADEHRGDVVRSVVGAEELVCLRLADDPEIGRPTDGRPAVGMRLPEHGVELLVELARRRRLGAQPALFVDDVTLGVELPEDRIEQPVGLHPEPELQLVRRNAVQVDGDVGRREGVEERLAFGRVDLVVLVLDHDLALLFDELGELGFELDQLLGPSVSSVRVFDLATASAFTLFAIEGADLLLQRFLLVDDLEIALDVRRADRRRSLEHHVLEEMRHAGDSGALVGGADLRDPGR